MSRLDALGENALIQRILDLQDNINDLKTSQFAGSSSLITERKVSGSSYDFAAQVKYQTTTAYELTINAADQTFGANPFVWQVFWNVVNTPATTGFLQFVYSTPPANGQQKYRIYFWGTDAPNLPETLNIRVVLYGLNLGSFSIVQII